MAWYNIYRPSKFEDVSGQAIVKAVLQNALAHNKIKHGYLLSGPKGTGKTTLARIFANNLNDLGNNPQASMDIIELDAASNSGVDNIRNLIESAKTAPFAGKFKVYIIDEVHMLSKSAMNALLKILEEPPEYLVFLLATTNPEKLLPTVLSRLTKLTLTSHTLQDIIVRLEFISTSEKMSIDKPSLELIAKRANGGQRDAINILETLYSYDLENYTIKETAELLGLLPTELLQEIAKVFIAQDFKVIKEMIGKVEKLGLDGESFMGQLLGYLLEQSFENGTDFDSLIIPVAEILDLKLPINTIAASFALIQAKLREKGIVANNSQSVQSDQKKNPSVDYPVDSQQPLNIKGENLKVNNEKAAEYNSLLKGWQAKPDGVDNGDNGRDSVKKLVDNNLSEEITNVNSHHLGGGSEADGGSVDFEMKGISSNIVTGSFATFEMTTDPNNVESNLNRNPQQIQSMIHSFTKSPLCVMMFKILIPQIVVEKIEDGLITLSLTAPTFVSQLENAKNQKLIIDHIFEQTNISYKLELTTRSIAGEPLKDHRTDKEILDGKLQSEDKTNRYEAPKPGYGKKYEGPTRQTTQTQPKNDDNEILEKYGKKPLESNSKVQSTKPSTKPAQKYFYSVYQGLPANTIGEESEKSLVPVLLESIPFPTKAEIIEVDSVNWGTEIEEIFDF
jgi:DNA polymerase III subunit gamma/tau